jgi:hypothetical protein
VSDDQSAEPQAKQTWWLTRWLKDDKFWEGIAVQTLGTLTAAAIIAIIAIFAGLGYTPAIRYFVIYGVFILASVSTAVGAFIIAVHRAWRRLKLPSEDRSTAIGAFIIAMHRAWPRLKLPSDRVINAIEVIYNLLADVIGGVIFFFFVFWIVFHMGPVIAGWTGYHT